MMQHTLAYLHLLALSVLVGKVVFLSFVTAPVLARNLEPDSFARVVRQLFPRYYALGMISAAVGWATITALAVQRGFSPFDLVSSGLWLGILAIENYCRTPLTPQINELSDTLNVNRQRGLNTPHLIQKRDSLHRLSVQLNSAVLVMGLCIIGLI
ncbi:MAG: hypothetical protein NPIRA02_39460 [Nitrospirales bacterium]|nr:MAG: hypothetical protein NPIRA02_39460 [Nitrospirales bacterium]